MNPIQNVKDGICGCRVEVLALHCEESSPYRSKYAEKTSGIFRM
jgi:hypothetical protein